MGHPLYAWVHVRMKKKKQFPRHDRSLKGFAIRKDLFTRVSERIRRLWHRFLGLKLRYRVLLIVGVLVFTEFIALIQPLLVEKSYALGAAESLLSDKSQAMANKISYDAVTGTYTFKGGATSTSEALQNGNTAITTTIHKDARKGVSLTDTINGVDFSMVPTFRLDSGRQDGNRVVYPLATGDAGWLVYTMQGTGVKEDILLTTSRHSEATFDYTLNLGDGLAARLETDGSIGIYGNVLLSGNVTTASDADAALLEKARKNAQKTTYLFGIPAPTIMEAGRASSEVQARYELHGSSLALRVTGLDKAHYPLTIDPSIYVVTAQQFMAGNNETNVNFDVDNKLIKKGRTTGARFNSWTTTSNLPTGTWNGATTAAGGYIYTVGGIAFNGKLFTSQGAASFTVPDGVTSLSVKLWGGGGGGGGGGSNAAGGAGGGGGATTATFSVTPGETLDVYVGGGGGAGTGSSSNSGYGGGGGGYSSISRSGTNLAIAAGGGGGGGGDTTSGQTGGAGGAGGGNTGSNGGAAGGSSTANNGGNGGTQSAGGTVGSGGTNPGVAGSSLTGGNGGNGQNSTSGSKGGAANGGLATGGAGGSRVTSSYPGGGGGGSGYFGGAGGNGANTTRGGSGGGGGSSYYTGTGSNLGGTGTTPGNASDTFRNGSADGGAAGAADNSGTAGDNGLVVVTYSGGLAATQSVNWAKLNTGSGTIDSANPGTGACSGWCTTSAYNLPSARSNFSLVAYNGFLYAIGGIDGSGNRQSTVYIAKLGANGEPQLWHPTNGDKSTWVYWYTDSGLSNTRSSLGAVAYNNRMYVIGGLTGTGSGTPVSTVQIASINPNGTLGSWSASTSLSGAVYGNDVQVYNDRLYVIGGSASVGGAPLTSIYFSKINSDGSLNSWQSTTAMGTGRMQTGGNFSVIWGAYLYVSGGCSAVNASGYCTTIRSDTQVASINADGSLDTWNTVGGVTDQRTGHSVIAWRDNIYEIGGCDIVSASTGECDIANGLLETINYGTVNPDGEASTVADSVGSGTAPCSGTDPQTCNLPGVSYIGNVLSGSAIMNGYLYIWGGCSNTTTGCTSVSRGVIYTSIGSDGSLTKPASCGSWSSIDSYCYNTTSLPVGFGAPGTAVANGYIYSIGGFTASGMVGNIYYAAPDPTNGSISSWTATDLTSIGATDVSYTYSFARANPSSAGSVPNNLYILGGCTNATGIGCPASSSGYTERVYKCNLDTAGAPSACVWNTQLQIGTVTGATTPGLGAMAGTVYANYIYLMGGLSNGANDLKTTRYAKIDNNNNIVAVSGSAWIESPNLTYYGRRRGSGFGYNGYLYVVGGFDGTGGGSVLADIEFAKINVSDGSIGTWTVSTVSINQRWGLNLTVSNSYAYVVGGCINGDAPTCASGGQTNSIQTFQVYNNDSGAPAGYSTSANTYSTNPNRIGVASVISDGYLYAAGGCTGLTDCMNPVSTVSKAAIDANGAVGAWTDTASLPDVRAWGKLLTAGNSLYYVGGQDASGASQSTVYYATPSGGTISSWSTATNGLPASRTQFGAAVWNNRLYVVGGNTGAENTLIYSTAGSNTFVVPSGVTSITVKAWGAGGSGGNGSSSTGSGGAGGGGGFSQATLTVTPGESLTVNVGSGGTKASAASNGGYGGGFSALLRSSTYLIQAGGGGGGGAAYSTSNGGAGGAGGGGNGVAGSAGSGTATLGGLGGAGTGTAGAGGTAGTSGTAGNSGAANLGGDAGGSGATCTTAVSTRGGNGGTGAGGKGGTATSCVSGGGGGGGAFGGGGGGSAINNAARGSGGGGGGSGLVTGSSTAQSAGSGTTPGTSTDTLRVSTAGVGGSGSTSTASTAGGSGEIAISYSTFSDTTTVYVSPQLNSGGNITSAWSTGSSSFNVARSGAIVVAYANNLYLLGGHDGANYLSDTQYAQINGTTGNVGSWTYSQSLPKPIAHGDGFAVNGYIYILGGRTATTTCTPSTLVAPISANTTIATGNNPTGVGVWYETNQRYSGSRYGNAAVYSDGKAYILGGGCGDLTTYASPVTQQTTLLTQPQVAKYSIMFDTDSDVFPNQWLLNGLDNSIGARWQLKYQSMTNPTATGPNGTGKNCSAAVMTTWGQTTNFGDVTLMQPGIYTPKDGSGTNTNCARYYFFSISIDSSQAFGYPDDVSRGPTITDLSLNFTADPAKRLMHGRTFVGGLQMPDDTPYYSH